MKAKLKMTNIADVLGDLFFEFNSGKLTLIRGPNGSGKTKIINSIGAIESFPAKSENLKKQAIKFGIGDSLINNKADTAEIELTWQDKSKHLGLVKNKKYKINLEGNENFLYTSMLYPVSRLKETVTEKNPDFSWILKELSLAVHYDTIQEILNSYSEQSDIYLTNIDDNEKKTLKERENLKGIQKQKGELNKDLVELNKEIDGLTEVDPDKKAKYDQLEQEIENYEDDVIDIQKSLNKTEKSIKEQESKIKLNQDLIGENQKKLNELGTKQAELKAIKKKEKEYQNEIIKMMEKEKKFIVPKNDLEKNLEKLKLKLESKSDECPTCGKPWDYDEKNIRADIKQKQDKLKETNSNINQIAKEIKSIKDTIKEADKLPEIDEKYKKLFNDITVKQKNIDSASSKLKTDKKRLESEQKNIESNKPKLELLKKEFKDLEKEIAVNIQFKELAEKKSKLTEELGSLNEKALKIQSDLEEYSKIELWGVTIKDNKKAKEILENLKNQIKTLKEYILGKSNEQKQGVAVKFNEKVETVLNEMKFSQFENVKFDLTNYQLKIFTKGNVAQNVNSLSGAEKGIILALLQISLKETYSTESPFFLVDEVIHNLDENRMQIFLNYLKNLAEKNDWFIILTKLGGNILELNEY